MHQSLIKRGNPLRRRRREQLRGKQIIPELPMRSMRYLECLSFWQHQFQFICVFTIALSSLVLTYVTFYSLWLRDLTEIQKHSSYYLVLSHRPQDHWVNKSGEAVHLLESLWESKEQREMMVSHVVFISYNPFQKSSLLWSLAQLPGIVCQFFLRGSTVQYVVNYNISVI